MGAFFICIYKKWHQLASFFFRIYTSQNSYQWGSFKINFSPHYEDSVQNTIENEISNIILLFCGGKSQLFHYSLCYSFYVPFLIFSDFAYAFDADLVMLLPVKTFRICIHKKTIYTGEYLMKIDNSIYYANFQRETDFEIFYFYL